MSEADVIKRISELFRDLSLSIDDDSIVLITDKRGVYVHIKTYNENKHKEIQAIEKELSKYTDELFKLFSSGKTVVQKIPEIMDRYYAYEHIKNGTPVTDGENYYIRLGNTDVYLKITEEQYKMCLKKGCRWIFDELEVPPEDTKENSVYMTLDTIARIKYGEEIKREDKQE